LSQQAVLSQVEIQERKGERERARERERLSDAGQRQLFIFFSPSLPKPQAFSTWLGCSLTEAFEKNWQINSYTFYLPFYFYFIFF
jgi:hypothetical protein